MARWSGLRRSSVVGAVDGVGCGEADGVAIAVMAVGDVDELVAQPQAEAGPGAGAVQGARWKESDKRVAGPGPGVGHGDGHPLGLPPQAAAASVAVHASGRW